jgi:hypothetical protein
LLFCPITVSQGDVFVEIIVKVAIVRNRREYQGELVWYCLRCMEADHVMVSLKGMDVVDPVLKCLLHRTLVVSVQGKHFARKDISVVAVSNFVCHAAAT